MLKSNIWISIIVSMLFICCGQNQQNVEAYSPSKTLLHTFAINAKTGASKTTKKQEFLISNENVVIAGWASNKDLALKKVFILVNGKKFEANYGLATKWLVNSSKNPKLGNCGYEVTIPTKNFKLGNNTVSLKGISNENIAFDGTKSKNLILVKS